MFCQQRNVCAKVARVRNAGDVRDDVIALQIRRQRPRDPQTAEVDGWNPPDDLRKPAGWVMLE
jgi:hypothetical protein